LACRDPDGTGVKELARATLKVAVHRRPAGDDQLSLVAQKYKRTMPIGLAARQARRPYELHPGLAANVGPRGRRRGGHCEDRAYLAPQSTAELVAIAQYLTEAEAELADGMIVRKALISITVMRRRLS
jgi:hypothetical protein